MEGVLAVGALLHSTVEPVRKGKYRPLPNLVNIFYDITGCRFNMFTIFEMEWKSLFHHVKEFHLDGSCIQDNLSISPADPRSYSRHAIILSAIGDRAPGAESTWYSAVAPWQSKTKDLWIDGRLDGWLDGNTLTFSVVQLCLYTNLIKTKNSDVF